MNNDNVLKKFTKFVGLNIIGMISTAACVFIDYLFVSMAMGTDGLTALGLGVPIFSILFGFGLMLGVGGGAKYAMLRAQGDRNQANQIFTTTLKMGCVIAIPFVLIGGFFATQFAALLGASGHILPMTASYIQILLILSPAFILYVIFEAFARNDNAPKIAMISAVIFNAMNIILDYLFLIVFGWGMTGAALASAVAAICALSYLVIYWLAKKMNYRLVKTKFVPKRIGAICGIGAPAIITDLSYAFILITFNLVLLSLVGNVGVAAFGIISSIALIVFFIFAGLGQGIQPLASEYYGRKERKNLIKILKYAFVSSIAIAVAAIMIIFQFAESITSILNFEQDMAVAELANEGIRIYFIAFLFAGITMISIAFLSVTNMPRVAVILSVLRGGVLLIPLIIILPRFFGVTGVWAAYPIAEFILAIVSLFCLMWANKLYKRAFKSSL